MSYGWRNTTVKRRAARTGMALLRSDDVVLVAVRKDMMRVIGDKLLSFLH